MQALTVERQIARPAGPPGSFKGVVPPCQILVEGAEDHRQATRGEHGATQARWKWRSARRTRAPRELRAPCAPCTSVQRCQRAAAGRQSAAQVPGPACLRGWFRVSMPIARGFPFCSPAAPRCHRLSIIASDLDLRDSPSPAACLQCKRSRGRSVERRACPVTWLFAIQRAVTDDRTYARNKKAALRRPFEFVALNRKWSYGDSNPRPLACHTNPADSRP